MEKEIKSLHKIIKDYRIDEGYGISEQRITKWINQFPKDDRIFVLTELVHIFKRMYFSKERAKSFLKKIIERLKKDLKYPTYGELLDNSNFLDLQAEGKSQKKLLELLMEVLNDEYNYNISNLGRMSKKHNIYIDDVLCTGNTFFNNIKNWVTEKDKNRLPKLRSKEIELSVFYIFICQKYLNKKKGQFYHRVSNDFSNLVSDLALFRFDKELMKPTNENLTDSITAYQENVVNKANEYAESKEFAPYQADFFRSEIEPEEFYTSVENRKRLELIFLQKGVDILNNSNVTRSNIRPLGYSLPSYKDFGFGALIFTWRNIANNTPLVFWYRGGGFMPLFVNMR
jgi:hypothetical protein